VWGVIRLQRRGDSRVYLGRGLGHDELQGSWRLGCCCLVRSHGDRVRRTVAGEGRRSYAMVESVTA